MRTVLVNPTRRKNRPSRKTSRRRKRNVAITRSSTVRNPKRKRRVTRRRRRNYSAAVSNPKRKRVKRSRRRNAGIAPFVAQSNPLILQNPPRRKRRRRQNPKINLQRVANDLLISAGGSAIAVGANILAVNKIENKWARNGVRVAASVFAPMFIKGNLGAAFSGAMLYPMIEEMARELNITPAEADLNSLAADLEEALNEVDYDEYGYPQENPVLW